MSWSEPRRILVLRGGALGDFLVTLPALLALRERWPAAKLELVGNPTAGALALNRRLLDAVYSQHDARWLPLFDAAPLPSDLRDWLRQFDLVVNYWPDPDGGLRGHFPLHGAQRFISAAALPTRSPAAMHYVAALESVGASARAPCVRLTSDRVNWMSSSPGQSETRTVVAAHPGSGSAKKNWPASRWRELVASLEPPVLLLLGEAEQAAWDERSLSAEPRLAERLAKGTLRILKSAPLETVVTELSQAKLFIGHDSGMSHLAAACGVPSVLLFGPTDPAMWAPPAPHVVVLRPPETPPLPLSTLSTDAVRAAVASVLHSAEAQ